MSEDFGVLPSADEADQLEQSLAAVRRTEDDEDLEDGGGVGTVPWDADEADVAEQARSVPPADDDDLQQDDQ
ncbi:MAG: hypothetical protein QOI06_153 [Nocardioidaceae bacterium]|jgi:hypothetical protein|nr:hypothetical protein [Nocardioidaceae bacterium]